MTFNRGFAISSSSLKICIALLSFSIAITLDAPSIKRARVNPQGPAPISITVPVSKGFAERAILRVRFMSNMKF